MGDRTKIADAQIAAFKAAWHKADAEGRAGERVRDGLAAAGVLRADPDTSDELAAEARRLLDRWDALDLSDIVDDARPLIAALLERAVTAEADDERIISVTVGGTTGSANDKGVIVHTPFDLSVVAERDAERAARERAEAEARQLREAIETAESVGVDYCTLHHGIRNEDEHSCDFRDDDQESGDDGEPRECVLVELIPRPPLAVVAEGAEDRGQTHTQNKENEHG